MRPSSQGDSFSSVKSCFDLFIGVRETGRESLLLKELRVGNLRAASSTFVAVWQTLMRETSALLPKVLFKIFQKLLLADAAVLMNLLAVPVEPIARGTSARTTDESGASEAVTTESFEAEWRGALLMEATPEVWCRLDLHVHHKLHGVLILVPEDFIKVRLRLEHFRDAVKFLHTRSIGFSRSAMVLISSSVSKDA